MKALVFAAGLGTRLRPLTDTCPKALVPVAGRPMLDRVIDKLVDAGVDTIVVNVHHHAPMIIRHLEQLKRDGVRILVSDESNLLLDTGGGILNASPLLDGDEPFIVHNADILTDFDIRQMVDRHRQSGADATLLVSSRPSSRYFLFDKSSGRLEGWTNQKTGEVKPAGADIDNLEHLAFGGVHVLSPSVLRSLADYAPGPVFSIVPFYVDCCHSLDIAGYRPAAPYRWHDIGSLEKLAEAEKSFN